MRVAAGDFRRRGLDKLRDLRASGACRGRGIESVLLLLLIFAVLI